MGKLWIEVCLISARGLRRSSSLWKLQWFAVGWVDPSNKYCTRIDSSGNANPVWKTKFAASVDDSPTNLNELALNVEVYSREPIFLQERLYGTATIQLKEFLAKHDNTSQAPKPGSEEVGSYQLRTRSSSKAQGFVDVSIRVSVDKEEPFSYLGNEGGDTNYGNSITLATRDGHTQAFPTEIPLATFHKPEIQPHNNQPYTHSTPMPPPGNYAPSAVRPSYQTKIGPGYYPLRAQPPPPPNNVGYMPAFPPGPQRLSETYINVPSSSAAPPPSRGVGPGFAMGLGAGALAAGAVIFGDDFMTGFDVPSGLSDPTIVVSTDPPF